MTSTKELHSEWQDMHILNLIKQRHTVFQECFTGLQCESPCCPTSCQSFVLSNFNVLFCHIDRRVVVSPSVFCFVFFLVLFCFCFSLLIELNAYSDVYWLLDFIVWWACLSSIFLFGCHHLLTDLYGCSYFLRTICILLFHPYSGVFGWRIF